MTQFHSLKRDQLQRELRKPLVLTVANEAFCHFLSFRSCPAKPSPPRGTSEAVEAVLSPAPGVRGARGSMLLSDEEGARYTTSPFHSFV